MDAAFSSIAFAEPATAEANLALLEQRLPGAIWAALPSLLGQVPDPDSALNYLERYLRDAGPRLVEYLERNPAALHYLLVIFSHSRFLSESLVQKPQLITWLHRRTPGEGLDRIKSREDLLEEFARFAATSFDQPPSVVLARFKRREYLRITLRDVLGLATLAETTLELSQLADVLLERALRFCEQKLDNAYGMPQATDSSGRLQSVRLTVLSLGKLGGQELNYSSDIDLMFLYSRDGQTSGGTAGVISNAEYFVRLSQAMLKLISEVTPEGAVFRVDLRLRPEGHQGDLAVSLASAVDYYRTRAREWELQMLIKARPSAGDEAVGRKFLREAQPLIYRPEFNLAAAEAVLKARQDLTRELRRGAEQQGEHAVVWNVKLSPGGIRDIEFLSQCLQRLYGGLHSWLAARGAGSTLVALQRLHDKGYLSSRDFFRLGTAYQFLRKVEHRLQLRDGLQRHTLPRSPEALARLARRCGMEPAAGRDTGEQLLHRIGQHFAEVREIYERTLLLKFRDPGASTTVAGVPEEDAALPAGGLLPRLRSEYPAVAQAFATARPAGEPHGRRGLDQFLTSSLLDPSLMDELESHPDWISRAGEVFARSDFAADLLSRHPEGIRILADPEGPSAPVTKQPPTLSSAHGSAGPTFEESMVELRIAHRKGVLAAVVRALLGSAQPFDTFAVLTRLAEAALNRALLLAFEESASNARSGALPATALESAPFAVIALGRLGTMEMDIGSDADVIFVLDEAVRAEEAERWRRLAERFVHVASSHTREGLLFPVDTRLRPRGAEGEMVQSAAYLRDYFRKEAEGWEAATFLKARPLAGNCSLAAATIEQVQTILAERFCCPPAPGERQDPARELARQLVHTRERLEREGASIRAKGGFKTLSGGFYDIEYVLAFLTLTRGLFSRGQDGPGHILRQVAAVESAGALDPTRAQTLRGAALLYRILDHAVRLVTGQPATQFPEPALIPRITRLLELWCVPVSGGLADTLETTRRDVRAIYEQIVLAACP